MSLQIWDRFFHSSNIIFEESNGCIARSTKKTTNFTTGVRMIDVQWSLLFLFANHTTILLLFGHKIEFFQRYSKSGLQTVITMPLFHSRKSSFNSCLLFDFFVVRIVSVKRTLIGAGWTNIFSAIPGFDFVKIVNVLFFVAAAACLLHGNIYRHKKLRHSG